MKVNVGDTVTVKGRFGALDCDVRVTEVHERLKEGRDIVNYEDYRGIPRWAYADQLI